MWPFTKCKRREVEQDAEYQAFLENHQNNPTRPIVRAKAPPPKPAGCFGTEPPSRAPQYRHSAVSYGPVDDLGISCTHAVYMHEGYPDQAND